MQLGRTLQIALLAVLCLVCWSVPVKAASLDELTPYLSGQYFTWREYAAGRRLLKESGPLFAAGMQSGMVTSKSGSSFALKGRGELFGGIVNYDGETQAPDQVPVQTTVNYFGARGELDLGYRYSARTWQLEPFGGLGYRWWLRALQDANSAAGSRVSGYTENWETGYFRLGARGRYLDPSGVSFFAEGGAKRPFYTGNSVDFAGSGWVTFRPAAAWSGFAETGVGYRHLKVALTYEGFRFAASPIVQVGTKSFYQPESASDLLGLKVGWSF